MGSLNQAGQVGQGGTSSNLSRPFAFADADEAHAYWERAAIREFDGNLPRAAAERLAMFDVLKARSGKGGAS